VLIPGGRAGRRPA